MKTFTVVCLTLLAMHSKADVVYDISLDTAPLMTSMAGPFSLAFQLADGSGTGDGNNAAIVSNVSFGGGTVGSAPALTLGSASGDLTSSVVLTDGTIPTYFAQQFAPGGLLTFQVSLTGNDDVGGIPDQFLFYVLDATETPIPTDAGQYLDALGIITIGSQPTIDLFAGDTTRSPIAGGGPISISAPSVIATPEPATLPTTPIVMAFVALHAFRRRFKHKE